jgi:hypothetical protein
MGIRGRSGVPLAARVAGALAAVLVAGAAALGQTVLYVNGGLDKGRDSGERWEDAFRGPGALQRALDAAAPIAGEGHTVQLWVAAGTYVPTRRTAAGQAGSETFVLASHEELYGGFVGGEKSLEASNPQDNVTILSGAVFPAPLSGGAWHVLTVSGTDATCIVDGLVVSGRRADFGGVDQNGAGILGISASPVIRRCEIIGNSANNGAGGGVISPAALHDSRVAGLAATRHISGAALSGVTDLSR